MAAASPAMNRARLTLVAGTRQKALEWAIENGLLRTVRECRSHRVAMTLDMGKDPPRFRCRKRNSNSSGCSKEVSLYAGSWFEGTKCPLPQILSLMYSLCEDATYEQAIHEAQRLGDGGEVRYECSSATVADWYNYCTELIVSQVESANASQPKIGGPGKVVQIDESHFGGAKYHKGRWLPERWVIGMIEAEGESDDFRAAVVSGRSSADLIPVILANVEPGTMIYTDQWNAYVCLRDHGYFLEQVNHSDEAHPFVNQETGVHTQRIESQWRPIKARYRARNPGNLGRFGEWLVRRLWLRNCRKSGLDPFQQLIEAIKQEYA